MDPKPGTESSLFSISLRRIKRSSPLQNLSLKSDVKSKPFPKLLRAFSTMPSSIFFGFYDQMKMKEVSLKKMILIYVSFSFQIRWNKKIEFSCLHLLMPSFASLGFD
jgi:hypothetical protein